MFLIRFASCPLRVLHLFFGGGGGLGLVPAAGRALLYKENEGELFWSFPIFKMFSFVDVIFL